MPVRHSLTTAAIALSAGIASAAPVSAQVSPLPAEAAVTGMTSGRIGPTLIALLGLIGVISSAWALTGSGRRIAARTTAAVVALAAGLTSVVLGGLFAATADGGPGTGNGVVAAAIAVVLGLISTILAGVTLSRSRRRPN